MYSSMTEWNFGVCVSETESILPFLKLVGDLPLTLLLFVNFN